jgi:hypothetical protein
MSTLNRLDLTEAWLIAERLLADEELERLDAVSDEEVKAELRADGLDATWVPSAESLMEGAEKHLAQQAAKADQADEANADGAPRSVSMIRATGSSRVVWLAAAAAVLLAVGAVAAAERDTIIAWLKSGSAPAQQAR